MSRLTITAILTLLCVACGGSDDASPSSPSTPDPVLDKRTEHLSAGEATVDVRNANAFSSHSKNLSDTQKILTFNLGNDFFENPWISGSSSTSSRDGVGALFNNNACQDCHVRDGRGHAPRNASTTAEPQHGFSSILFKAVRSDVTPEQSMNMAQSKIPHIGDSAVGAQIQHDAVDGVQKEAVLGVSYTMSTVTFDDGFVVELRKPQWQFTSIHADDGHDFDSDTVFSARIAPPMIGMGLLDAIPELEVLMAADAEDIDNDGISGKANYVWSAENKRVELGRFGWKAGQPSVLEQTAGAFLNDMGLTSRLFTQETCLPHQTKCLTADNGNGDAINQYDYEVADRIMEAVVFYSSHLGVPQRRNAYSAAVLEGKAIFIRSGCGDCHRESFTTEANPALPELSNQKIYPYTDLLLHDMGESLADVDRQNNAIAGNIPVEYLATTVEWRTPPLWGLGLTKAVDPEATFLHDGRARTIMEAILWHGGEAESAKKNVLTLTADERDKLLLFLNDL